MKDNVRKPQDLRERTKRYALSIISLSAKLPKSEGISVIRRQLLRSGTSVAAHYREGHRARSDAEFVSKINGALQELDESALWIELLIESNLCDWPNVRALGQETEELIKIFVTIAKRV